MDEKYYREWMARWDKHDRIGTMLHRAIERGEARIVDIGDAGVSEETDASEQEQHEETPPKP
jgi:hypothetical protein